jgi:hypothetical protein
MCPAMALGFSDQWRAEAHRAASLAFRVSAALDNHAQMISLAANVWQLDRALSKFLEGIYLDIERRVKNNIPPEPVKKEVLAESLRTLRTTANTIEGLYSRAKASGLTNRTLVGTALNSVRVRGDEILDLVESIELAMNPDIDKIFEKSLDEFKRGETFELADIV